MRKIGSALVKERKRGGQRKCWDHEVVKFLGTMDMIDHDKRLPDDTGCEWWFTLARDCYTWQGLEDKFVRYAVDQQSTDDAN